MERDHIPNTFDALLDWARMVDWSALHQYAWQAGNGGPASAVQPKTRHLSPQHAVLCLKQEYDRVPLA